MSRRCRRNCRYRALTVLISILALLFVQAMPLHAHSPHAHHDQLDPTLVLDAHDHHPEVHIWSSNASDNVHGPTTEIDLTGQAVIKNLKFDNTPLAIIFLLAVIFVTFIASGHRWSFNIESPFTTRGIAFRPPLRAPPL